MFGVFRGQLGCFTGTEPGSWPSVGPLKGFDAAGHPFYGMTTEKTPLLDAPLVATIPARTMTCTAPLWGLARVIVTVWALPL